MDHGAMQDRVVTPIDTLSRADALTVMRVSHERAVAAVAEVESAIDAAAEHVATALAAGGALHYAAAGSSGLMALADACELTGTFGIAPEQVRVSMAGGVPVDGVMPGDTEDNERQATDGAHAMVPGDVAIVVSASGTTPFALAFAQAAKARGNTVIAIANVPGAALLSMADVAIGIATAPEVVEGSTRLGAGTAQKVALNMISTQAGILLGHVHDGLMVNLVPDNIKLRRRARQIVERTTGAPEDAAQRALERAGYDTKLAVLIAAGLNGDAARKRLGAAGGRLRTCMPDPNSTTHSSN